MAASTETKQEQAGWGLRLATLGVGQIELLKRGFPEEPEALRPRLRLTPGGAAGVVIFTRRGDAHWMLIGRRLSRFQ